MGVRDSAITILRFVTARDSISWGSWFISNTTWAALCLSLTLGRTTPLTVSRWWLLGFFGILAVSFLVRIGFKAVLKRAIVSPGTMHATMGRAALTDIPFAATLPVLVLVYLSDIVYHALISHPILLWTVVSLPAITAMVSHEAVLHQSTLHAGTGIRMLQRLPDRSRFILQEALAATLLVGIALLFFWPVFTSKVPIPADLMYHAPPWNSLVEISPIINNPVPSDTLWFVYPYAHFRHQVASSSVVPLWNPHTLAGAPSLADPDSQALQPLHLLFTRLPPAEAITIVTLLYFVLAGLAMYAFLRFISLQRGPALVGAVTYMCGSSIALWLQLTYLTASVGWLLPLALLSTELIMRGHFRWGVGMLAPVLGLTGWGSTYFAVYIVLALGLYVVWMLAAHFRSFGSDFREIRARVLLLAGCAVLGFGFAAAQFLPSLELTQLSQRAVASDASTATILPLTQVLTLLVPGIMGYPPAGTTWVSENFIESTLYVGILPLCLAGWAAWACTNRHLTFGIALIVISLFLGFGLIPPNLLAAIFPPSQLLPQTGRILVLPHFGFSLLAAFGASALLHRERFKTSRVIRLFPIAILLLLAVAAIEFWSEQWPDPTDEDFSRAAAALLDGLPWLLAVALASCGALIVARRYGNIVPLSSVAVLGAIIVIDLSGFAAPLYTYTSSSLVFPETPALNYLKQERGDRPFRITGIPRTTLLPNAATVYGLDDARGYSSLYPLRIWQFSKLVSGRDPLLLDGATRTQRRVDSSLADLRLLSLLNVEFILVDKQYRPTPSLDVSLLEYVMESPGTRGVILYRNPNVLPRAFLVGNAETVASSAEAIERLQDPGFKPARQIVLENSTTLPAYPVPQDTLVEVEHYTTERVLIHVETDTPAWLLLTDTYYPGWQVTVNGEFSPIYAADLLFRAVAVPAGSSDVEFTYRPDSWRWGVRISLFALTCWLAVLLFPAARALAIRAREGELMRWLRRTSGNH